MVIIGHTVKFGGATRNFIYSFHMPLFFLLSGYTYKFAAEFSSLKRHFIKGLRHLILPCLLVSIITILASWSLGENHTVSMLWQNAKHMGDALWWASGVKVKAHPAAGAIWFLFSLFWAKIILDSIHLLFPGKNTGYLVVFIGLLGIALGCKHNWLPQNTDVTLVAALFVYLGKLWREKQEILSKYASGLFFMAILIWISCQNYNLYIEMATRSYPLLTISLLEAVAGSFAFCCLCQALANNTAIKNVTMLVGRHTLLILLINHLDWIIQPLWQTESYWGTCGLRIVIDLLIALVINRCWYLVTRFVKGKI